MKTNVLWSTCWFPSFFEMFVFHILFRFPSTFSISLFLLLLFFLPLSHPFYFVSNRSLRFCHNSENPSKVLWVDYHFPPLALFWLSLFLCVCVCYIWDVHYQYDSNSYHSFVLMLLLSVKCGYCAFCQDTSTSYRDNHIYRVFLMHSTCSAIFDINLSYRSFL